LSQLHPTPVIHDTTGCLCADRSPHAFAPGSYASVSTKDNGMKNRNHRMVKAKGAPAIVRMGHLHRFLAGLGDDSGYVDYSNDLVEPTYDYPVLPGQPLMTYQLFDTSSVSLPGLTAPSSVATIPNLPAQPNNPSVLTSALSAAGNVVKAVTQPSPTTTVTPAQLAQLQAAQRAAALGVSTPLIPGISNTTLLIGAAIVAAIAMSQQ